MIYLLTQVVNDWVEGRKNGGFPLRQSREYHDENNNYL